MSKLQSMRDFSGGVVNQELQNRDDGRGVFISANNVVSSPNGELRKRTGIRFLGELPYRAKLVPFRMPDGDDLILVFSQRGDGADAVVGKVIGYTFANNILSRYTNVVTGDVPSMPAPSSWSSNTNGDWVIGTDMPELAPTHPEYFGMRYVFK